MRCMEVLLANSDTRACSASTEVSRSSVCSPILTSVCSSTRRSQTECSLGSGASPGDLPCLGPPPLGVPAAADPPAMARFGSGSGRAKACSGCRDTTSPIRLNAVMTGAERKPPHMAARLDTFSAAASAAEVGEAPPTSATSRPCNVRTRCEPGRSPPSDVLEAAPR